MTNEEENILESQLGNTGGLGKISSMQDESDAEMDAFLAKARRHDEAGRDDNVIDIRTGFVPISREEMGKRSLFYPEDWEFRIKPATVEAVKNWSAIDDADAQRIDITNNIFNEIIKNNVAIYSCGEKLSSLKINSWDRFWFILKVREFTFKQGETKIAFDDTCSECEGDLHFELNAKALYYDLPDDEVIEKHWSKSENCWVINPQDYEVAHAPIKLYTPTLERDAAMLQWCIEQKQKGKKLNDTFLKFLPWLLKKSPKDANVLDKFIKECKKEFDAWDTEMFSFMDSVRRNVVVETSDKLRMVCPHCGEEVTSNVQFPNGLRSLFSVEGKHKKFGTK